MVNEVIVKVKDEDPVKGHWHVSKTKNGVVWCDTSSIAIGTVLEVDGRVVQDASWLRKKDNFTHINVAELESVLKGSNLALKQGLQDLEVKTDSGTVCGWIETIIREKKSENKRSSENDYKMKIGQSTRTGSKLWTALTGKLCSINEKQSGYTDQNQEKLAVSYARREM